MLQLKRHVSKGAAAAAAAAGWGIAVASASGSQSTTATTIRLLARGGSATFVNVRHQPKPAVGDEVILSQPIFSAAHPAQRVGHGWVTVTLVGGQATQDHATLALNGGQVDAAGDPGVQPVPTGGDRRHRPGSKTPAVKPPCACCRARATGRRSR